MAAVFLYGFVHEPEDLIAGISTEKGYAVLLEVGEPFEDGRSSEMAAAMHDAFALIAYPLDRTLYMFLKDIYHPTHLTWSHTLSMFKIITDIFEDPRAPKRSTTNHHGIYAILLEALFGALGSGDIAIADDGDMNARIAFNLSYEGPVGFAGVHLAAGATMDSERLDSAFLELLRKLGDDAVVVVPSKTRFDRNRQAYGIYYRTGDIEHLGDVFEKTSTRAFIGHFLHRTAEIDVDKIGLRLLHDTSSCGHGCYIFAVNLNGNRPFFIVDLLLTLVSFHIANEGIGIYKFGIYACGPKALAEQAKSGVGDVLHRSEVKRIIVHNQ